MLVTAARRLSDDVVAELHRALVGPARPPLRPAAIHYTHVGPDGAARVAHRAAAGWPGTPTG